MDFQFEKTIKTEEDVKRLEKKNFYFNHFFHFNLEIIFEQIISMHPEDKDLSTQIFQKESLNLDSDIDFDSEFDEMVEDL